MSDLDLTEVDYIATEIRAHASVASRAGQTAELDILAARIERLPDLIAAQVREQIAQEIEAQEGPPTMDVYLIYRNKAYAHASRIARGGNR